VYNALLKDISIEYEEVAIVQADKLPHKFYIANKDKILRKRYKEAHGIWKRHYIAHATEKFINAIIIDIDSNVTADAILSVLPPNLRPTSIIGLKRKRKDKVYFERPHVRFNLRTPVKKDSIKQLNWLKSITAEIQRLISHVATVDSQTPAYVTKNPLSGKWDFETFNEYAFKEYDLKELSQILDLKNTCNFYDKSCTKNKNVVVSLFSTPAKSKKKAKTAEESRNCEIFNTVRFQSYNMKYKVSSYHHLYDFVVNACHEMNDEYREPLSSSEVKAIARSISYWTWNKYTGSGDVKNRGAARKYINDDDDIRKRQQKGAYYSHKVRTSKAIEAIAKAISEAKKKNIRITKKIISEMSEVSLTSVKKYWNEAQSDNVICITDSDRKLADLPSNYEIQKGVAMVSSERTSQNKTINEDEKHSENIINLQNITDKNITLHNNSEIEEDEKQKNTENIEKLDSEIEEIEENVYYNSFNEKVEIPKFLLV
jgi:hypothetical protein